MSSDTDAEAVRAAIQRFLTDDGTADGWFYKGDGFDEADELLAALAAAGLRVVREDAEIMATGTSRELGRIYNELVDLRERCDAILATEPRRDANG